MADEELDAALVETMCERAVGGAHHWVRLPIDIKLSTRDRVCYAVAALGIPAAALNALARGEATVVPKLPTFEQAQAGGKADYANAILSPVCTRADNAADIYTAMLAASPYAKE